MEQEIYEADTAEKTSDQWRQYTKDLRRQNTKCRQQAARYVKRFGDKIGSLETELTQVRGKYRAAQEEIQILHKQIDDLKRNYAIVIEQLNAVPKSIR